MSSRARPGRTVCRAQATRIRAAEAIPGRDVPRLYQSSSRLAPAGFRCAVLVCIREQILPKVLAMIG
jgi:hypothetical protein